jgi:hypothetical protein
MHVRRPFAPAAILPLDKPQLKMARKKQRGTCALCLHEKELRQSHLLGRAIYELNRDGNADPVMITPQLITPTQRQIWRHLLCGDCGLRFSSRGESLIMRLVQRKTEFALLDRLKLAVPLSVGSNVVAFSGSAVGVDTGQLAYFALSVLWRSGVQQWRTLNQQTTGVSLGVFAEPIRKYLAGESGFPPGVVVAVTVCTDRGSRLLTLGPWAGETGSYCLLVRGLWFHILTNASLSAGLLTLCCVNSDKKVLFVKDCEKEILQKLGPTFATAYVSPKLAPGA